MYLLGKVTVFVGIQKGVEALWNALVKRASHEVCVFLVAGKMISDVGRRFRLEFLESRHIHIERLGEEEVFSPPYDLSSVSKCILPFAALFGRRRDEVAVLLPELPVVSKKFCYEQLSSLQSL